MIGLCFAKFTVNLFAACNLIKWLIRFQALCHPSASRRLIQEAPDRRRSRKTPVKCVVGALAKAGLCSSRNVPIGRSSSSYETNTRETRWKCGRKERTRLTQSYVEQILHGDPRLIIHDRSSGGDEADAKLGYDASGQYDEVAENVFVKLGHTRIPPVPLVNRNKEICEDHQPVRSKIAGKAKEKD